MSQQIARLERIVGHRLVERSRGQASVALTPRGQIVLTHADEILDRLAAAQAEVDRYRGANDEPPLRISVNESLAARLIPTYLAELAHAVPNIRIMALNAAGNEDHSRQIMAGETDVILGQLPVRPGALAELELIRESLVLLVAQSSPLAHRREPLSLADVAQLPLVEHAAWRIDALVESGTRVVQRSDLDSVVHTLVAQGEGVSLVPRMQPGSPAAGVAALELEEGFPPLRIGLMWSRHRDSDGLARLRKALSDACLPVRRTALAAA